MSEKNFFTQSEFDKDDNEFKIQNFEDEENTTSGSSNPVTEKNQTPIKPKPGGFVSFQKEEAASAEDKFKDIGFIQDHSIVSSVEDYALRVRMEADEYANKKRKDADDYHNTNIKIVEDRRKELQEETLTINNEIKELTEERDKIYEKIKKDAYKEGFREGKNEMLDQTEDNIVRIRSITEDLTGFYGKLLTKYEKDMMETALLIAAKVIKKDMGENRQFLTDTFKQVINNHKDEGKIKIYIHPKDLDLFKERPEIFEEYVAPKGNLTVEPDENMTPGSIQVETNIFYIDTDIGDQLDQMKSEIRKAYYERLMTLTKTAE